MVFGNNAFYPMASLTTTVPVVTVGGLAKQFLIPGWRVGWITVHDRNNVLADVRTAYFKLSQNILGASSLAQVETVAWFRLKSVVTQADRSSLCCIRVQSQLCSRLFLEASKNSR